MKVIIIGAGGHGKVIADIVIKSGHCLLGFLDDSDNLPGEIMGYPLLGKVSHIDRYKKDDISFSIGIGHNQTRYRISHEQNNLKWFTAIHPSAQIAVNTVIGEGTVVMANSVINPCARIGKHCIINTGAVVEHDNIISDFVHISPNAVLGGTVTVGTLAHVGIGAVVKNNTNITDNVVVGAGAVVIKDIKEQGTYVGVPACKINIDHKISAKVGDNLV